MERHLKLSLEVLLSIAWSVCWSVLQCSLNDKWYPFPRCSLMPISSHVSTICVDIVNVLGKSIGVGHRWCVEPPFAACVWLSCATNYDSCFLVLHKLVDKFFCYGVVDQCYPSFFDTIKFLANTNNTIMLPSRDTNGVIHHLFCQLHVLTAIGTGSVDWHVL